MTPLEMSLHYARRGWRVVPVKPGYKYPHGIDNWQTAATTDEARIRKYWGLHPTHGVCIATGAESGLFAIDIDPDNGGDDSLHALEKLHGPLPDTVMSLTGGGGVHYLFAWPEGHDIRNSASGVLGVGIDVRGTGGQVVVAPTVHPNGRPYCWEVEHDPTEGQALAQPPAWLVEALTVPTGSAKPRQERRERPVGGDVLPGDWWAAGTTWAAELARYGWALHSTHHDLAGDYYEMWTRPGKDVREGASASLYYRGSDVLKVFSSNATPLVAENTYTLWGLHVAMEHGGDFAKAAASVRTSMQVATAVSAAAPPTTDSPVCPHCGSTRTKEVAA